MRVIECWKGRGGRGGRGGVNLNALEFRKFLINRSARDRIRVAICILNIS